MEPPPFQEAARCDVCKCSFNTFRRRVSVSSMKAYELYTSRYSSNIRALNPFTIIADAAEGPCVMNIRQIKWLCRNLVSTHLSEFVQIVITTLPIAYVNRRKRSVAAELWNVEWRRLSSDPADRPAKGDIQASVEGVDHVTDSVSKLDVSDSVSEGKPIAEHQPGQGVPDCKCGMPLCICEAPAPFVDALHLQRKTTSTTSQSSQRPKRDPVPKNRGSTSTSNNSSALSAGQVSNGAPERPKMDYDVNGEGLREAIKNDDAAAVKKLLSEGVDPNYHDKQGMSLLHLAAVFNRTDIAFILMEHGASLDYRNAQGETPLDCAPVTLQYKMRQKMEEGC